MDRSCFDCTNLVHIEKRNVQIRNDQPVETRNLDHKNKTKNKWSLTKKLRTQNNNIRYRKKEIGEQKRKSKDKCLRESIGLALKMKGAAPIEAPVLSHMRLGHLSGCARRQPPDCAYSIPALHYSYAVELLGIYKAAFEFDSISLNITI